MHITSPTPKPIFGERKGNQLISIQILYVLYDDNFLNICLNERSNAIIKEASRPRRRL